MSDSETPGWVVVALGVISILMGALVIGAVVGWVPMEGRMLAPPWIVASIGGIFVLFGLMLFIPEGALQSLRGLLLIGVLALVTIVCNWSGFAPDVSYSSSSSLSVGPLSWARQGGDGSARVVFMLAAIGLDAFLIFGLGRWIWSRLRSN